jgi:hypothetical protein
MDTRVYTSLGLWRVKPYVQFLVVFVLLLDARADGNMEQIWSAQVCDGLGRTSLAVLYGLAN